MVFQIVSSRTFSAWFESNFAEGQNRVGGEEYRLLGLVPCSPVELHGDISRL
jgi:hypothetical protein